MTKKLFIVCAALVWTVALVAQNISVVAANGSTKLYRTLQAAIEGADPNSTIYLPGGGFSIADSVKITKKLTIIGIGHKTKNDNVDGVTTISGNLFFNEGSSGSAIMACYITGNVNIGEGGATVNDVLIKYCNLNRVYVHNPKCTGTFINQNYIRGASYFNNANAIVSNNIIHSIHYLDNGVIAYNILANATYTLVDSNWGTTALHGCDQTQIINNIVLPDGFMHYCWNCEESGNMMKNDFGSEINWNDVFANYNGGAISSHSDFHFTDEYKQYENQVGVYANGVDFDKQLAPVPYIVAKKIDEQTDAAGKLNIKIRVKASGEE